MFISIDKAQDQRTIEIGQWKDFLKKHSACADGFREASTKTSQEWYDTTERSDWVIWVLRKCPQYKDNKNLWVRIAINCAKEVIHLSKDPQNRPQKAIEAAEAYLLNPCEETKTLARHAADAAADAASIYATAYTDDAYAYAAAYAASAAASAAATATAADAAAIYATAYTTAARSSMRKKLCEVIRKEIPIINIF